MCVHGWGKGLGREQGALDIWEGLTWISKVWQCHCMAKSAAARQSRSSLETGNPNTPNVGIISFVSHLEFHEHP